MRFFDTLKYSWNTLRWKMLIIFAFFSVISMILVACLSIAVLNVVIRRESAFVVEERINIAVDTVGRLTEVLSAGTRTCQTPSSPQFRQSSLDMAWPGSQSSVTFLPIGDRDDSRPKWLQEGSSATVVVEQDRIEIRSFHLVTQRDCSMRVSVKLPLSESFLGTLSTAAGLQITSSKPELLQPYRSKEGIFGEVEANFFPGSGRAYR